MSLPIKQFQGHGSAAENDPNDEQRSETIMLKVKASAAASGPRKAAHARTATGSPKPVSGRVASDEERTQIVRRLVAALMGERDFTTRHVAGAGDTDDALSTTATHIEIVEMFAQIDRNLEAANTCLERVHEEWTRSSPLFGEQFHQPKIASRFQSG